MKLSIAMLAISSFVAGLDVGRGNLWAIAWIAGAAVWAGCCWLDAKIAYQRGQTDSICD